MYTFESPVKGAADRVPFLLLSLELSDTQSMSLKYEPTSEPLLIL